MCESTQRLENNVVKIENLFYVLKKATQMKTFEIFKYSNNKHTLMITVATNLKSSTSSKQNDRLPERTAFCSVQAQKQTMIQL